MQPFQGLGMVGISPKAVCEPRKQGRKSKKIYFDNSNLLSLFMSLWLTIMYLLGIVHLQIGGDAIMFFQLNVLPLACLEGTTWFQNEDVSVRNDILLIEICIGILSFPPSTIFLFYHCESYQLTRDMLYLCFCCHKYLRI